MSPETLHIFQLTTFTSLEMTDIFRLKIKVYLLFVYTIMPYFVCNQLVIYFLYGKYEFSNNNLLLTLTLLHSKLSPSNMGYTRTQSLTEIGMYIASQSGRAY